MTRTRLSAARSAALFAAAAAALVADSATNVAATIDAIDVAPGETVLGDIAAAGTFDEFRAEIPRGARAVWTLATTAPSGLDIAIGGMVDSEFRQIGLLVYLPIVVVTDEVPASGRYSFFLTGNRDTTGGYRALFTLRPQKRAAASGEGDGAAAPLVFGALAGATVDAKIRWSGPSPVTLASIDGPTGPLAAPAAAVVKGSGSVQRGFAVTATGDHSAVFDIPAGTVSWSALLTVRSPKPARVTRDLRDPDGGPPPTVELFPPVNVGQIPYIRIVGERGGPNDLTLGSDGDDPIVAVDDPRAQVCLGTRLPGADPPTAYVLGCASGVWRAHVRDVVRDAGGRVTSFEAPLVTGPDGSGSCSLEFSAWDASGRPTAWRETRRFHETGRVHVLEVADAVRLLNSAIRSCRVTHTPPGGSPRTYEYAPFR